MPKKYVVSFSRYAEEDLDEIIDYFFPINPKYAEKLFYSIEKRINELDHSPGKGRIIPELEKQNINDYRELIEGNYRIVYTQQNETVTIHAIIDSRRNLEDILIKKLLRHYL
jgi:plasmid stabilization system protein ParE